MLYVGYLGICQVVGYDQVEVVQIGVDVQVDVVQGDILFDGYVDGVDFLVVGFVVDFVWVYVYVCVVGIGLGIGQVEGVQCCYYCVFQQLQEVVYLVFDWKNGVGDELVGVVVGYVVVVFYCEYVDVLCSQIFVCDYDVFVFLCFVFQCQYGGVFYQQQCGLFVYCYVGQFLFLLCLCLWVGQQVEVKYVEGCFFYILDCMFFICCFMGLWMLFWDRLINLVGG